MIRLWVVMRTVFDMCDGTAWDTGNDAFEGMYLTKEAANLRASILTRRAVITALTDTPSWFHDSAEQSWSWGDYKKAKSTANRNQIHRLIFQERYAAGTDPTPEALASMEEQIVTDMNSGAGRYMSGDAYSFTLADLDTIADFYPQLRIALVEAFDVPAHSISKRAAKRELEVLGYEFFATERRRTLGEYRDEEDYEDAE